MSVFHSGFLCRHAVALDPVIRAASRANVDRVSPPRIPAESCVTALHTKPVTCWFILECMPCGVTEFWWYKRRICVTGGHTRFHQVPLCYRNSDTKLNVNGNQRFPSPPCLVPNVSVKAGCFSPKSWNPPKRMLMNEVICENTFMKHKYVHLPFCSYRTALYGSSFKNMTQIWFTRSSLIFEFVLSRPACLHTEVIGEVVGDRPGTLLPWKPNRSPLPCGVRLRAVIQAVMLRSAKLSYHTLHTFKMSRIVFRLVIFFIFFLLPHRSCEAQKDFVKKFIESL